MKNCLVTTGISEFWGREKDLLLLGPWCLAEKKNRQLVDHTAYCIVPSPWEPPLKIKEAADFCHGIYEEILPELSRQLNLMHGVSCPERYWRVLIGPWLAHFIGVFYERYKRIENAFTFFPESYTYVLPEENCTLSSFDTYDFVSVRGQATRDYYNLKLFSLIVNYLYLEKAVEKVTDAPSIDNRIELEPKFTKRLFYDVKKIKRLFCHPDIVLSDMYRFDYMQILSLESESRPNSVFFENFENILGASKGNKYSREQRSAFKFKEKSDKFQTLLRQLIAEAIPMSYVENFEAYRRKTWKLESVKAVGSAVGWYFNEGFKYFAAEALLKGAKLLDFQHGGGYGVSLSFPAENISLEKDMFYTWGWRSSKSSNTLPLPSPYLSKLKNTHQPCEDMILFIGNCTHKYICRFFSITLADDIPGYFGGKKIFFQSLRQEVRDIIRYRPYQEIGWNEDESIHTLIPHLKFLKEGKLPELMRRVKLVVIDHQSTSYLEAFTINVPCICYWEHDVNLIRPEAEEDFFGLADAGILYKHPAEAAEKVNEIFKDPLIWWQDPKVQKAKNRFCEKFALTSRNWRKEWINALNAYR